MIPIATGGRATHHREDLVGSLLRQERGREHMQKEEEVGDDGRDGERDEARSLGHGRSVGAGDGLDVVVALGSDAAHVASLDGPPPDATNTWRKEHKSPTANYPAGVVLLQPRLLPPRY